MFRPNAARRERARRILESFRQHGATSPDKAMTSEQLGLPGRFDEFMDRRGGRAGVIIEASEGKYYLDEARLKEAQAARAGGQVIIKEREIVKIRCSYCGGLYNETENKCPHCGAPAGR
jgi:hypothetical protein